VILEAGLGGASTIWARIQPEVAKVTQVCSYDRAGSGWSDPGPRPRDASHIASELHALLEAAGIPGPYVLVGHSYGGLYARVFAGQYPEAVAGMVLLESSHPDQYSRTPQAEDQFKLFLQLYSYTPVAVRLGIMRLGPFCRLPADYPAEAAAQFRAVCTSTDDWDTERAEVQAIPETMIQVREAGSLGGLPLAVVSAGGNLRANPVWGEYQQELAALSTDSVQIVIEGAGHTSVWFDAEDARASVQAILLVIDAVRTGRRVESSGGPAGP
jgi:pimeloyl-ACP methyl ester carboxylesterase